MQEAPAQSSRYEGNNAWHTIYSERVLSLSWEVVAALVLLLRLASSSAKILSDSFLAALLSYVYPGLGWGGFFRMHVYAWVRIWFAVFVPIFSAIAFQSLLYCECKRWNSAFSSLLHSVLRFLLWTVPFLPCTYVYSDFFLLGAFLCWILDLYSCIVPSLACLDLIWRRRLSRDVYLVSHVGHAKNTCVSLCLMKMCLFKLSFQLTTTGQYGHWNRSCDFFGSGGIAK